MNIGSWNVRDLNGPLTQNKVADLVRQHNLTIFGLVETKLMLDRIHSFMHRKFRDWSWCSNLNTVEGGRILIMWNPLLVDCNPRDITKQAVHCSIVDKTTSKKFACSFVYGFNIVADKRELWSSLISWGINNYDPWILLGDFNSTLFLDDRMDGIPIYNSD